MRGIRDLQARPPSHRHRRWAAHRCPAVVAAVAGASRCAAAKDERKKALRRAHCRGRKASSYVCPGLKACRRPDQLGAFRRRSDVAPTVVAHGVDTLWLYTRHDLPAAWCGRLAQLAHRACSTRSPVPLELAGVDLAVQPKRLARGKIRLANDFFDVLVCPEAEGDDEARVRVELRALGLWSLGWEASAEKAIELMAAVTGATKAALDVQVSRLDLCADVQGWRPTQEDRLFFHTRARAKGRYFGSLDPHWDDDEWIEREAGRLHGLLPQLARAQSTAEWRDVVRLVHRPPEGENQADFDSGRRFTGFVFGRGGPLSARIYDKTHEAAQHRKGWMRGVWRESLGYLEGRDADGREEPHVWRIEPQFRREVLKEFQPRPHAPLENLGSWERCKEAIPRLWRYVVDRWLRYGRKTTRLVDGQKVNRFEPARAWQTIARAFDGDVQGAVPALHREAVCTSLEAALPQLVGYASQVSAALVERGEVSGAQPFGGIMAAVLQRAYEHASGELEARFEEKHEALRARRRLVERFAPKKPPKPTRASPVRWKSEPVRFVPGLGLVGGLVTLTKKEVGW